MWDSALTSEQAISLYNNGTPEDANMSALSPKIGEIIWWCFRLWAGNNADLTNANWTQAISVDVPVTIDLNARSVNMTEQNLVNNNVSVLNGESVGMNTTSLVQK